MSLRGIVIVLGLIVSSAPAYAQTDYSAGKTPAQLFSGDCSVCHKSPRGLAKNRDARALTGFLREHYTSKAESAGALAAYLLGNPGTPADAEARKRQGTPAAGEAAARPARAEPGDDSAIAAPEGRAQGTRQQQTARGRKPTAAELVREREAAAKAAEEAAKAKLRAYASTGDAARPLATDAPPPEATSSAPATPPAATAEPAPPSASTETPKSAAPAETSPPAAERPAATPPG